MSIELIIDYREQSLYDLIKVNPESISLKSDNLLVGDIIVQHLNIPLVLVERKTIADYISSIKDGRLKNQSIRTKKMVLENPGLHVIYLIEGHIPNPEKNTNLISSFIGKIIRDQFTVYRTASIAESANFIENLAGKYIKNPELIPTPECPPEAIGECSYLSTVKLSKKGNLNPELFYLLCLSNIPGMSSTLAENIQKKYPTLADILQIYTSNLDFKSKCKLLITIDGIGQVLSKRAFEYITPGVFNSESPK